MAVAGLVGTEIRIGAGGACVVTSGAGRQTRVTTPRAIGLALLSMTEDAAEVFTDMQWMDLLATHGVAMGVKKKDIATLMIVPPSRRTVTYSRANQEGTAMVDVQLTLTFPPVLMGCLVSAGRYTKGVVFLIDTRRQSVASVIAATPLLVPFPYGNIYADSGKICWGSVSHADIHTPKDLEALFFSSGFNKDLFQQSVAAPAGEARSLNGLIERSPEGVIAIPPAEVFTWTFPGALQVLLGH